MKTKKEIDVELVRIEGDLAPFVMVDYLDRDAHEYSGLLLIDSGSTANILSHEMSNFIGYSLLQCRHRISRSPAHKWRSIVSYQYCYMVNEPDNSQGLLMLCRQRYSGRHKL